MHLDAFGYALYLLKFRTRTIRELSDRLRAKGYTARQISAAIARLVDYGYVNDQRYAETSVRAERERLLGDRLIASRLLRKGVPRDIIKKSLQTHLSSNDEAARARVLIEKRIRTPGPVDRRTYARLVRFLAGRGFSSTVIYDVLKSRTAGTQELVDAPTEEQSEWI